MNLSCSEHLLLENLLLERVLDYYVTLGCCLVFVALLVAYYGSIYDCHDEADGLDLLCFELLFVFFKGRLISYYFVVVKLVYFHCFKFFQLEHSIWPSHLYFLDYFPVNVLLFLFVLQVDFSHHFCFNLHHYFSNFHYFSFLLHSY